MNRIARRVAAVFALLTAMIFPVGYINPFNAMDHLGASPPPLAGILVWMLPLVTGLLLLAWLLDPLGVVHHAVLKALNVMSAPDP